MSSRSMNIATQVVSRVHHLRSIAVSLICNPNRQYH
jgi:hypothetical protein